MKRILLLVVVILMFVPGAFGQGYIWRNMRWSTMLGYYIPRHYRWSTMLGAYVHRDYRWSPLAPSDVYPYPYYFPPYDCPPPIIVQPSTPRPSDPPEVKRITKPRKPREQDGKLIVYNYLRNKGFDVDIVDGFSFRNQTVSTIFLIRSQNWLIKYQNPELEKSLGGNPLWEKYKKRWEEKEKEYKARGWKVGILNK